LPLFYNLSSFTARFIISFWCSPVRRLGKRDGDESHTDTSYAAVTNGIALTLEGVKGASGVCWA
jgi:hypothetical protein